MNNLKIRSAEMSDHATVCKLYDELFNVNAAMQPEYFRNGDATAYVTESITREDRDILLAEDGGEVAGFVMVMEADTPPYAPVVPHRYGILMDLVVWPQYRSRGLGATLVQAAKDWAVERGLDYLELTVLPENEAAQKLYWRSGFEEAMVTMRCPLPPARPVILN